MPASAYMPDVRTELAFNAGVNTPSASRVWTDISDYVELDRLIGIVGGRQDERATTDANRLSLTLDNSDGRFTPDHASSPYYPDVKIGRPIRIRANLLHDGTSGKFEDDATGWSGSNATVARSTAQAHSGAASLAVTASTAANMSAQSQSGLNGFGVEGSATYFAEAWVRAATTGRTCDLRVDWYDAAGALISTTISATLVDSNAAWSKLSMSATSPSNAVYARMRILVVSPAAGEVHYVDDVALIADLYTGFVDEWPLDWSDGTDVTAYTGLLATSRLARLGAGVELKSIIEETILADAPVLYYTLGEAEGATRANDSSGDSQPPLTHSDIPGGAVVTFGTATGPGTDGLTAATISVAASGMAADVPVVSGAQSIEAFFAPADLTVLTAPIASLGDASGWAGLDIRTLTSGEFGASYNGVNVVGTTKFQANTTYHVAATFSGTTLTLYVNGVAEGSAAVATGSDSTRLALGARLIGPGSFNPGRTGVVAHLAVFDELLTAVQVADHADAGLTGFAGETPAGRITRYASYAGVGAAELSLETGQVDGLAHVDTTGKTAVADMREVETTERGVLFDGKDGNLRFHDRAHRYAAASAFTLNLGAQEVEADFAVKYDRTTLVNEASTATSDGKFTAHVTDETSQEAYGHARLPLELATTDPDEPLMRASWEVGQYANPRKRIPTVTVQPLPLGGPMVAALLAADVGTRFTLTNVPPQYGAATQDFFIEGYSYVFGPELLEVVFNVTPADVFDVWILGDSTYGVLGSTTRLAY